MIDKFMLFVFGSSSLGGIIAQITNGSPGTINMQYLLMTAVGALGCTIVYLHKQNQKIVADLVERLDKKETAMSKERTDRIDMLMRRMSEDTEAKLKMFGAITSLEKLIRDKDRNED
jgi:hypothetical protein